MRFLYKPVELLTTMIGVRLGRSVFKSMWARIDTSDPPDPTLAEASLPKVVAAAALEGATMAAIAAAVDRGGARAFHHLTGIWPGRKHEELPEKT